MADGPVVVNSGGSTAAIAIVVAVIAVGVLLLVTGVIDFGGGGAKDVNVKIDVPAVESPSAPANGG